MNELLKAKKYDPWNTPQDIAESNIAVHCCRYWMLSEWNCENMSFPFWRLYHSRIGNAYVTFKSQSIEISHKHVVVIPPYTPFSTQFNRTTTEKETINGYKIQSEAEIEVAPSENLTDQLFIHFNLGMPYDTQNPGIYVFEMDQATELLIKKIETGRIAHPNQIDFKALIDIIQLILIHIGHFTFNQHTKIDQRIAKVLKYIDSHLEQKITYETLSGQVNMANNSFARLFKENMSRSVNKYILEARINKSISLLHHSTLSIEAISEVCGFYDRNHYSKIFLSFKGQSPAVCIEPDSRFDYHKVNYAPTLHFRNIISSGQLTRGLLKMYYYALIMKVKTLDIDNKCK